MRIQAYVLVCVMVTATTRAGLTKGGPKDTERAVWRGEASAGEGRQQSSHSLPSKNTDSSLRFQPHSLSHGDHPSFQAGRSHHEERTIGASITCDMCKTIVGLLHKLIAEQKSDKEIIKVAIDVCKLFRIETDRICEEIVPLYSDMVLSVVRGTVFSPDELCGYVLGDKCAKHFDPFHQKAWNISISGKPKPPVKPHVLPKPGSPKLRVLHLSDIHLDLEYREGADTKCGEPQCCRDCDTYPEPDPSRRAGKWGDYNNCCTPLNTLTNLFQHLSSVKDHIDYAIFTGDMPAQDVWNQTKKEQVDMIKRLSNMFSTYLPSTPIYVCVGNHESSPCNSFPPDTVKGQSMDWLYGPMLQCWGKWMPGSVKSTIMRGGFYTISPYPGFRIISLNSNYGAIDNWWLLLNNTDPQGQLQWLADTLQDAEDKGEKVHILTHHPPSEILKSYGLNYYRLVNRYESTIAAQFYGHTHRDEYELFYDLKNISRPVNMAYNGGSITTYGFSNPAFRIYTIDGNYAGSSWEVLDYTHYYLDIPQANKGSSPVWQKEYSAKETYRMPHLFPEDWNNLVYRMKANDTLFQQFYHFYAKSVKNEPCENSCKKIRLCSLKTAGSGNPHLCDDL